MIQRVHNVCYLATFSLLFAQELEANKRQYQAIALPKGAELLHLSLEVKEPCEAILADVCVGEEVVGNDIDLSQKGVRVINFVASLPDSQIVSLKLDGDSKIGEVVLRAEYYLPSTIKTEFL